MEQILNSKKWYCNAYPDRVEIVEGRGIALHHADCTELIPTGELGPALDGDNIERKTKFERDGIVGIYRSDLS